MEGAHSRYPLTTPLRVAVPLPVHGEDWSAHRFPLCRAAEAPLRALITLLLFVPLRLVLVHLNFQKWFWHPVLAEAGLGP